MGMSSINGIGGGMSTYGSKGMGGLMSGLDVDELVKGMTSSTSGKIAKLMQQKQSNIWKGESYRSISSPLVDFANKYINTTSNSNLSSYTFFSKSSVTASGSNSKYLSTSGKSNSADNLQILEVKQLAEDANRSLIGGASGVITSGKIDLTSTIPVNNVKGQTITIDYNNKEYKIALADKVVTDSTTTPPTEQSLKYGTAEEIAASLDALIKHDPNLADLKDVVIFDKTADNKLSISLVADASATLKIKSGTKDVLKVLGLDDTVEVTKDKSHTSASAIGGGTVPIITNMPMTEALAGKSVSFTYNGVTKNITLGTKDQLDALADGKAFASHIQDKLSEAFGNGRVKVDFTGNGKEGNLSFMTTKPKTLNGKIVPGDPDTSSVIKISSADEGLLGKDGIFGIEYGASNRVNINATANKSGLKGMNGLTAAELTDKDGKQYKGYVINVNGKEVTLKEEDRVADIMSKINGANAGVNITYNEISDTFNIKATDGGSSGRIEISDVSGKGNLAEKLFNGDYTSISEKGGKDAEIIVDFDGVGQGADATTIIRNSNNFNLDGLNVTVNQVFDSFKKDQNGGYIDNAGNSVSGADRVIDKDSLVRFTSKADADKIVEAVKKMAEDYNNLVDVITKTSGQKHDKNYVPLTAEQKKEMSEDEIKAWEEKAKEGLLFNDSTLNILAGDLRFVFSSYADSDIKSIGISNSGAGAFAYQNNGKITVDEEALRTALAERPDDVAKLFADPLVEKMVDGKAVKDPLSGGVMSRMKVITEKYAKTIGYEKGILIEKAGHPAAPVSMFSNAIQKANDQKDKAITRLEASLKSEEARYYKQFTQLEQLISQMNSQSGALSELTGGA